MIFLMQRSDHGSRESTLRQSQIAISFVSMKTVVLRARGWSRSNVNAGACSAISALIAHQNKCKVVKNRKDEEKTQLSELKMLIIPEKN